MTVMSSRLRRALLKRASASAATRRAAGRSLPVSAARLTMRRTTSTASSEDSTLKTPSEARSRNSSAGCRAVCVTCAAKHGVCKWGGGRVSQLGTPNAARVRATQGGAGIWVRGRTARPTLEGAAVLTQQQIVRSGGVASTRADSREHPCAPPSLRTLRHAVVAFTRGNPTHPAAPTSGSADTPKCFKSWSPSARVVARTPITRSLISFHRIWPPSRRMRS